MSQTDRAFNDGELKLLRFLWDQGKATLGQLVEAVYPQPKAAVQTTLDGLVKEGFVACDRSAKDATYVIVEDEALPAGPAAASAPPKQRSMPRFLGSVFGQIAPAVGGVAAAAGAAVASAAAQAARKAVADATANVVANAASASGKVVGSMFKAAGKAALSKVTGAKQADKVVEQIAESTAEIGKQVTDTVAKVVQKIVTEAMKQNPDDVAKRKDG
jgi:hypothetical protein